MMNPSYGQQGWGVPGTAAAPPAERWGGMARRPPPGFQPHSSRPTPYPPSDTPLTQPENNTPVEPWVVVSGVLDADSNRVRDAFRFIGTVVEERQLDGDIMFRYASSGDTASALSRNAKQVVDGVWVSVSLSNDRKLNQQYLSHPPPPRVSTQYQKDGKGTDMPAALPIPAVSLSSVFTERSRAEVIVHRPVKRPHWTVRWGKMKQHPKRVRRDAMGNIIHQPLFNGQQIRFSIPLPSDRPAAPQM